MFYFICFYLLLLDCINKNKILFFFIQVDVILLQQNQNDKEYLSNIEVLMTKENEVILSSLIHTLKHMGFSLEGAMIFYYDFQSDFFVYCGNDPLSTNIYIPIQGKKSKPVIFFSIILLLCLTSFFSLHFPLIILNAS